MARAVAVAVERVRVAETAALSDLWTGVAQRQEVVEWSGSCYGVVAVWCGCTIQLDVVAPSSWMIDKRAKWSDVYLSELVA